MTDVEREQAEGGVPAHERAEQHAADVAERLAEPRPQQPAAPQETPGVVVEHADEVGSGG